MRTLLSALPPQVLRFVGQLQFRLPLFRPVIAAAARLFTTGEGVIRYGVGAGLRFNARGSAAGFLLGTSEIQEQEILATLLRPGDTFYDIGANVGFYSTIAARLVGEAGRVYAFEPFGPSAELAMHNARINGFSNVTVVQAAVSSEDGEALLVPGGSRLSTHYHLAKHPSENATPVRVLSIDRYVAREALRSPNLVMIDAEGAEVEVLQGMIMTIRAHRPAIMCEVHWTGDAFVRWLEENLFELGYRACTYAGGPLPNEPCRYHALLRVGMS